jgi:hypothetical protein
MRKHHKRKVQSGGATPDGKIPFPLMTKGERFIRCRGQRQMTYAWFQRERFIICRGQRQRIEAWFLGEKIYQIQRTEAWLQGEHE